MEKKILFRILSVLCCLTIATNLCYAQGDQPSGNGTKDNPYQIKTYDELLWFANFVNEGGDKTQAQAILKNDIVANENLLSSLEFDKNGKVTNGSNFKQWTPIGTNDNNKFSGTFDGAGHTISGLYFNDDEVSNAGLFGKSTKNGSIKNVGVVDSYIKGKNHVGGIVGHNGNCTVSNVFSTSTVEGGECVGGIAGYIEAGTIKNAYNMGAVSGAYRVGGIAGENHGTTAHINNVYSSGTVSGPKNQYVRGLVGYNDNHIDNAYYNTDFFSGDAVGNVSGTNVEGMTTAKLAALSIGFVDPDFPLLTDETESPWVEGSGTPVVSNGKLVYKLPKLKIFNSQPEVVLFNVQEGSDENDYCEIVNADDLFKFAKLVNDGATGLNAKLMANICVNVCGEGEESLLEQVAELEANGNLSSESFRPWTPIGVSEGVTVIFDGNGHTISGLYINKTSSQQGLFGQVIGNVTISNLGVVDFYVKGKSNVGSLAGQVTGKLNIKNCYSAGYVGGETYVGGFVGLNKDNAELKIENSYNESSVNASSSAVGGLVGENCYASLTIANSYNVGTVTATDEIAGGLVGDNDSGTLNVSNSYNVGIVTASNNIAGGLVGGNVFGTLNVSSSFFVETNGDGLAGEAKTSDEFANGTVTNLLNTDQSPVVWVQGKEYPILKDNHIHSYENGFCVCGNYVQPVQDKNGVYQISNAGELYWFADFVNQGGDNAKANAILTNNIVVNTEVLVDGKLNSNKTFREWTPIGNNNNKFQGTFYGNGKTISGLYFNNSDQQDYVGLFGYNQGTIQNVGVVESYFNGNNFVGGVCGYNYGTITNCYNTGKVSGGENSWHIGGVCGYNEGTIKNCYNTGKVSGGENSWHIGGVCGYNEGTIEKCYNTGEISGSFNIGGVSGYNEGTIKNCYNTGKVSGTNSIGGVCGDNQNNIEYCYNTGKVSGTDFIGGVCGYNEKGTFTDCYNNIDFCEYNDGIWNQNTFEFCTDFDFSDEIWSAGSAKVENGKVIFTLPYFNDGYKPIIEGEFVVKVNSEKKYYFDTEFTKDDISEISIKVGKNTYNDKSNLVLTDTDLKDGLISGKFYGVEFSASVNLTDYTYKTPIFTWNTETVPPTAKVSAKCNENSKHNIDNADCEITKVEGSEIAATCVKAGTADYKATYKTLSDTKTVDVTPALGHSYGAPVFTWTEFSKAIATFTCEKGDDKQTIEGKITSEKTIEPTATQKGKMVYTATFEFNGDKFTDKKEQDLEPTPTHEISQNSQYKVWGYNGVVYIETENTDSQVQIFDINGRLIKSESLTNSHSEIIINKKGVFVVVIDNTSYKVAL